MPDKKERLPPVLRRAQVSLPGGHVVATASRFVANRLRGPRGVSPLGEPRAVIPFGDATCGGERFADVSGLGRDGDHSPAELCLHIGVIEQDLHARQVTPADLR